MESILDRYLEQKKLYEQNGFNFENVEDLVIRNAVSGNIQDLPGHPNITVSCLGTVKSNMVFLVTGNFERQNRNIPRNECF